MISHPHRAIFFHVGKTAGRSVERMFVEALPDPLVADRDRLFGLDAELGIYLQHATCATVMRLVGRQVFDGYFKFAIVRNPYTRLYSAYRYNFDHYSTLYGSFGDFIRLLPEVAVDSARLLGSHLIPQTHYVEVDGRQVVDYVGRFEEIGAVAAYLNERLSRLAPLVRPLVPQQPAGPFDYPALYDDEMVRIMQSVYRSDFDMFGYPDTPAADPLPAGTG
jgi:hypothetical protein